ncbi:DUF1294 domain-containing protein [Paraglaciecola sp. 20A4]|uniref:DUF1294 domain-containing protein n=1 Tax=Paraglaciecola sp. 20A4 TaxID=2687288 RepID=UPI001F0F2201|nr:DUF1294 domain-containing protein [Paraglaciecola sp. 20A4]
MNHHYIWIYLLIFGLAGSYGLGMTPLMLGLLYALLSLSAYVFYKKDKVAAIKGNWRVPEQTLHLLALFGGWPGAIIAQQRLRHKTQKVPFRVIFWLTLVVNVGLLVSLHTQQIHGIFTQGLVMFNHNVDTMVNDGQSKRVVLFFTMLR